MKTHILIVKREGGFMKKKIAIGAGVLLIVLALVLVLKPASFEKKVNKIRSGMESYQLQGTMEITSGEDVKSYAVTTSWKKDGENEYFRVSLLDKSLNQQQIILKNNEGVFVITPSLNQVFKFQGEWPMNSPKPYLLQSLYSLIDEEHECKKESDGYLLKSTTNYPSTTNITSQEIKFNKDVEPMYLTAYDKDQNIVMQMKFESIEYNNDFPDDTFATPTTNVASIEPVYSSVVDLPLYPMSVFDSKLVSTSVATINGETQHVMEFSGEKEFTIVQTEKHASDQFKIVDIKGQLVENLGIIGYVQDNKLTVLSNQVEYTVYSNDLSASEMLEVVESMQVSVMK